MARRSEHTRAELKTMLIAAAERIVAEDGLRKVTIRGITKEIGYTSGSLYIVFKDLDELIMEVHMRTLERLYNHLSSLEKGVDPEADLITLAHGYKEFTSSNKRLWTALFEHKLPDGDLPPERYQRAIFRLIDLGVEAIRPLYPEGEDAQIIHDARVLWASLYGIMVLDASNKLSRFEETSLYVESLVKNYVAGIEARVARD